MTAILITNAELHQHREQRNHDDQLNDLWEISMILMATQFAWLEALMTMNWMKLGQKS